MRAIPTAKLKPLPKLPNPLLHKSGVPLIQPGEALTADAIGVLKDMNISEVYFVESGERLEDARHKLMHVAMPIDELKPGDTLSRTVYDQEGHLLLEEGASIPDRFAASLEKRGIKTIYFKKSESNLQPKVGRKARAEIVNMLSGKALAKDLVDAKTMSQINKIEMAEAKPEDLDVKKFAAKIDKLDSIDVNPVGEAFARQVRDTRKAGPATAEEKAAFSDATGDCIKDINEILKILGNGSGISVLPAMDRVASRTMGGLIRNRDLLMLCGTTARTEDYLVSHSLAVTVISINIGTAMGYGGAQIKALAYGAILADVGMLKMPQELLDQTRKLTPREHAEIRRHPSLGMDILQRIPKIPVEVPYIVYQSHEKANGSGYPGGKRDVVIHPFAKIVNIADTYSAMCANRPYRKAKLPYEVMEHLVLMCGKRELNPKVMRAFLTCNSMFPVGSFVRLADGRFGRVVAANPDNYMKPIVALLYDAEKKPLASPERIDMLESSDLTVKEAIDAASLPEIPDLDMAGF